MPNLSLRGNPTPALGGNGLVYLGFEDGTLAAVRQKHKNQSLEEIFLRTTGQEGI